MSIVIILVLVGHVCFVDFSISITRVYRHEICKRQPSVLVVPGRLRALCAAAAAAGHAAAAIPCFCHCLFALDAHVMAMSWLEMASPRLVRPLGVAAASSAALADRGWVRPGPVLAGAWPISAPSWLAAARPFSPAPGRSSPLLSDTGRGMRRPMATAACLPATEVRLALPPHHVRDVGSLLFNGRVYEHAAYMYVYETRETRTRSRTSPHATRRSRGHAGDNEAQSA